VVNFHNVNKTQQKKNEKKYTSVLLLYKQNKKKENDLIIIYQFCFPFQSKKLYHVTMIVYKYKKNEKMRNIKKKEQTIFTLFRN
jgi:hypothetical protein